MSAPQVVLFVCTGNYYRSRYAELLFNARVPSQAGWHAESRGFEPSDLNPGPISRAVLKRLADAGIAAPATIRMPLLLTEEDLERASLVVALDGDEHPPYVAELFPRWCDHFRYWRIADLGFMAVDDALSGIERAVDGLLVELTMGKGL